MNITVGFLRIYFLQNISYDLLYGLHIGTQWVLALLRSGRPGPLDASEFPLSKIVFHAGISQV